MKDPVREHSPNYTDNPTQFAGFRVVEDATYGFRRLDPIPPETELNEFYESRYYDLLRQGNRAPDVRWLMEGGDVAAKDSFVSVAIASVRVCQSLSLPIEGHPPVFPQSRLSEMPPARVALDMPIFVESEIALVFFVSDCPDLRYNGSLSQRPFPPMLCP
jgi:hypothetical protein